MFKKLGCWLYAASVTMELPGSEEAGLHIFKSVGVGFAAFFLFCRGGEGALFHSHARSFFPSKPKSSQWPAAAFLWPFCV